jgi:membrane protein
MGFKIHSFFSFYWEVLKDSFKRFAGEDELMNSAAISYYMVFSLPPMLFIIFWSAGLFYDDTIIREAIFNEYGKLVGESGSNQLMSTIEGLTSKKPTWWQTAIGIGALLFMVSTVFVTIQNALNEIFEIMVTRSISQGLLLTIRYRFLSIAMLAIVALILTFSLVVSALINAVTENIVNGFGDYTVWLKLFDSVFFNFITLTLLFTFLFRYIPDIRIKWNESWFGGVFTAILFITGKSLIGMLIGNSEAANFYDAAGSVLVLMLWVYYSSAIFLFGAIFTHSRTMLLNKNNGNS